MHLSKSFLLPALFVLFMPFFISCGQSRQELRVYSIIHEEETEALISLFTQKTGIPVTYERATTGELVNRVIEEQENPQADILLGGSSTYHMQADSAGALEPYDSPLAENIPSYAKSSDGTWTGFCVLALGLVINQNRFSARFPTEPIPETWDDLLNPLFENEIVMTDPKLSSTGYLFLQNQLQRLGWYDGWKYLDSLKDLVGAFPTSGSAPAKMVCNGEYCIGISYIHVVQKNLSRNKTEGIKLVVPAQSAGDVDCVSILKNTKKLKEAKMFVDFMLSTEAQELMESITFTTPVNPETRINEKAIKISDVDLIDYDRQRAAEQKEEVLTAWTTKSNQRPL